MKIRLLFALIALSSVFVHGAELTPPERAELLEKLRAVHQKEPSLESDFTEEKTTHLLNKPVKSFGALWFQAPDKFRREVRGSNPSTTVSNGKVLWIYYPNFQEAEFYTLGQRAFFDDSLAALTSGLNFERIDEYYNFRAWHDEGFYRLELVPKKPGLKRIVQRLVLVLDDDFKPHQTELFLPQGDRLLTNYLNARRIPSPASTFEFTPPPAAHISRPLGK